MRISGNRRDDVDVNVTPLIDVVFLLLIFFMVSTTFERESELGIELPKATSESEPTRKEYIEVSVDAKGRYYLDGRQLVNTQRETLAQALRKAMEGHEPQLPVVVSADSSVPYGSIMMLMDVAQSLNLTRLRFAAQRETKRKEDN